MSLYETIVLILDFYVTNDEKQTVNELRNAGLGYKAISKKLNIPLGTVKTVCRRSKPEDLTPEEKCKQCGKKLVHKMRLHRKIFCSAKCRNHWWNANLDKVNCKAYYSKTCAYCGRDFMVYGRADAKYCSRACYVVGRGNKHE
jgi:hypothetical protein